MIVQLAGSDVANRTASKDSSYNKRPQVINLKQKKKQDLAQFLPLFRVTSIKRSRSPFIKSLVPVLIVLHLCGTIIESGTSH